MMRFISQDLRCVSVYIRMQYKKFQVRSTPHCARVVHMYNNSNFCNAIFATEIFCYRYSTINCSTER